MTSFTAKQENELRHLGEGTGSRFFLFFFNLYGGLLFYDCREYCGLLEPQTPRIHFTWHRSILQYISE